MAGVSVTAAASATEGIQGSPKRFVKASRRMAQSMQQAPSSKQTDPGTTLIELLDFADTVACIQPPRPFEPLTFPVLSRLVEARSAAKSD
jgi:hypothetical protein